MLTYEYVKALLDEEKDVPYRTCPICNTLMLFTMRQYLPHLQSCKCRRSGETALLKLQWEDLKGILEGKQE